MEKDQNITSSSSSDSYLHNIEKLQNIYDPNFVADSPGNSDDSFLYSNECGITPLLYQKTDDDRKDWLNILNKAPKYHKFNHNLNSSKVRASKNTINNNSGLSMTSKQTIIHLRQNTRPTYMYKDYQISLDTSTEEYPSSVPIDDNQSEIEKVNQAQRNKTKIRVSKCNRNSSLSNNSSKTSSQSNFPDPTKSQYYNNTRRRNQIRDSAADKSLNWSQNNKNQNFNNSYYCKPVSKKLNTSNKLHQPMTSKERIEAFLEQRANRNSTLKGSIMNSIQRLKHI